MSSTFYPKKPKDVIKALGTNGHVYERSGGFDMNVAGRWAMTAICTRAGYFHQFEEGSFFGHDKCIPYVVDAAEAKSGGAKLRMLLQDDKAIQELYKEQVHVRKNFEGSVEDFRDWIASFATFLELCGGYDCE